MLQFLQFHKERSENGNNNKKQHTRTHSLSKNKIKMSFFPASIRKLIQSSLRSSWVASLTNNEWIFLFNSLTDAESGFVGNFLFSSKSQTVEMEYYFTFLLHELDKYLDDKYILSRGEIERMQLILYKYNSFDTYTCLANDVKSKCDLYNLFLQNVLFLLLFSWS